MEIWKKAVLVRVYQTRQNLVYVVVLQRTAKKCRKIYNARAEPLLCSLMNLLFSGVVVVGLKLSNNSDRLQQFRTQNYAME